jgi:predicted dehydrogenase
LVGHVFIFNQTVQRVRNYIDSGKFGRVYYVSMVRTNLGPIRPDANAAWDLMSHDISIAIYRLGAEPEGASAVGGTWINPGVEDAVFATLRYPGDILLNIHASWLNPRNSPRHQRGRRQGDVDLRRHEPASERLSHAQGCRHRDRPHRHAQAPSRLETRQGLRSSSGVV